MNPVLKSPVLTLKTLLSRSRERTQPLPWHWSSPIHVDHNHTDVIASIGMHLVDADMLLLHSTHKPLLHSWAVMERSELEIIISHCCRTKKQTLFSCILIAVFHLFFRLCTSYKAVNNSVTDSLESVFQSPDQNFVYFLHGPFQTCPENVVKMCP